MREETQQLKVVHCCVDAAAKLFRSDCPGSQKFPEGDPDQEFGTTHSSTPVTMDTVFALATAANATRVVGNRTFIVCPDGQTETCLSIMGNGEWGAARTKVVRCPVQTVATRILPQLGRAHPLHPLRRFARGARSAQCRPTAPSPPAFHTHEPLLLLLRSAPRSSSRQ